MKRIHFFNLLWMIIVLLSCSAVTPNARKKKRTKIWYDGHVHIMSPKLIEDWKALGIPFSKEDYHYSNIDSILKRDGATTIALIGMGYVYGSQEFYKGKDGHKALQRENDYLFNASKKYPKRIIPYFAIDPLKEYALEEMERCLAKNTQSGLKLHFNASQVYLTEPAHLEKVIPVFKLAAQSKLPILLHFDNSHPKFGETDVEILVDSILRDLPPVKLTIAHFGTSGGFNQKTKNVLDTFILLFSKSEILRKHTILFDISGVALDKNSEGVKKLTDTEFAELKRYIDKLGKDRIVFGTDYPLYTADEYVEILKTKVGLSESDIQLFTTNRFR